VETGLTSGLLAAAHARRPGAEAPPTLRGTGLYGRFDAVASVSGGSWFAVELIYSERFLRLIEDMAASPAEAAAAYRTRWTEPLLSVADQDSALVKDVALMLKLLGRAGLAQDVLLFGYWWRKGLTWNDFCKTLFEHTAGIDPSITLGSPVSPWAEGKAWLVAHTRVTPSPKTGLSVHIAEARRPTRSTTQAVADLPGLSVLTPAAYSYVLGSAKAPAPVPYLSAGTLPPDARLDYQGVVKSWCPCGDARHKAHARVGDFSNLVDGAADLPVVSCAAASSAVLGGVVLKNLPTLAMDALGGDFAVWQGAGPAGESFSHASALVNEVSRGTCANQAAVDKLAEEVVQPVIDGGYVDNSGIGCAVRAGAVEVVAYLDNDASNTQANLAPLFQGASQVKVKGVWEFEDSPIFEQSAEWMMAECARFPKLKICAGAKFLSSISVGTLDVTTTESSLWGTRRGTPVTLHLVSVASTVTIGYLENLRDYDVLIQETIETMAAPENADLVQNTVMPWFLQPADKDAEGESTGSPPNTPSDCGSADSPPSAASGTTPWAATGWLAGCYS